MVERKAYLLGRICGFVSIVIGFPLVAYFFMGLDYSLYISFAAFAYIAIREWTFVKREETEEKRKLEEDYDG